MPLIKSKSKSAFAKNIEEMMRSKTFGKGKSPAKRSKMAVAAAYANKRKAKK